MIVLLRQGQFSGFLLPARALFALRQSVNGPRLDELSVWAACEVNQALVVDGLSA